jgi:hypothetical protein
MAYLTKQTVTAQNQNGDTLVHEAGAVLSDWELSDFIRGKIASGEQWYRERFEPLLEREAHRLRIKITMEEGSRDIENQNVAPPFDDYVGLHPNEIIQRMQSCSLDKVRQIKLYERAGMNRQQIVAFVTPSERAPWDSYEEDSIGDILEKLSICSDPVIAEAKMYEANHLARPVIVSYDRATFERTEQPVSESLTTADSSLPPPAPVQPEPQPVIPQEPFSPAPPMSTDRGVPDLGQIAAQQQPAVTQESSSLAPIGAPPR